MSKLALAIYYLNVGFPFYVKTVVKFFHILLEQSSPLHPSAMRSWIG